MKTYTPHELKQILESHALWLATRYKDEVQGDRADLSDANLSGADLIRADLIRADLSGADLIRANLSGADLIRANLIRANLSAIAGDLLLKCLQQPHEVAGLLELLTLGKIDGSAYVGECACFVGSIEKLAGTECKIKRDCSSPVERWFLGIEPGDTPETSQIVAITSAGCVSF